MTQYQKIDWNKIPKQYFVKVPNRLMMTPSGYYRPEYLTEDKNGIEGEYEVFYDERYVAYYIAKKILKPLQITRPQVWGILSSEAFDVHRKLNLCL